MRLLPGLIRPAAALLNASRGAWTAGAARWFSADALGLTYDQLEFQRVAQGFARDELLPHAADWDAAKHFPVDTLRRAAELGFAGIYVGEDVGGSGLTRGDAAMIFEALAYGDVSTTAYLTIHNMVSWAIDTFGSNEQRQQYLPRLTTMDMLGAYCLTEPGSGSDAASLKTVAHRDGSDYRLTGNKAFISGGGAADVYLVMARTDRQAGAKGISAFLVEKGTAGLSFGARETKLGWNSQPTTTVTLDGVRVPETARLAAEGDGFRIAMRALDGGRINIAACSVGGAQFCLDHAAAHVASREQFGQPVGRFQNTQFRLADMATGVSASRLMVRHAATALDAGDPSVTLHSAMAKRFATDTCFGVANDALQLLGGYGYLRDYPIERYVRDLRVHSILEGTNEIMRLIIGRELERERS